MAHRRVIVAGGGAAGLMAAGQAALAGAEALVLEKMERPGRKLLITGQGRCNLTNVAPLPEFLEHFGPQGRFLRPAFSAFFAPDLLAFFEQLGVATVTQRGGRIFPASEDARDVLDALIQWGRKAGVAFHCRAPVERLIVEEGRVVGVETPGGTAFRADAVIIAAGGAAYPATGSTGDGCRLAESAGHRIVPLRPALVPLETAGDVAQRLQGLSLRSVSARLWIDGKKEAEEFGEMLFTHFGLSGPIILTLSKRAVEAMEGGEGEKGGKGEKGEKGGKKEENIEYRISNIEQGRSKERKRLEGRGEYRTSNIEYRISNTEGRRRRKVVVSIDLKPALDDRRLDERLLRDLQTYGKRQFHTLLGELLPAKLIPVCADLVGISPEKVGHQVTAEERKRLRIWLKDFRFEVTGHRGLAEAIVTAGGVDTREVDPRTMASRLAPGLYFAGETLDVDADTGGFNLQAAFSTGWLAGRAAAKAATTEQYSTRNKEVKRTAGF